MKDPRDQMAREMIEAMKDGELPWERPTTCLLAHRNGRTGRLYQGFNAFWLDWIAYKEEYSASLWLTWKDCKALGGHPKKEEWDNSTTVVWFRPDTYIVKDSDGEPVLDSNGDPKERRFFRAGGHQVWNVDQTTVDPKRYAKYLPKLGGPVTRDEDIDGFVAFALEAGVCAPIVERMVETGSYSPDKDRITMPTPDLFKSSERRYSTMFHEIAHSTGHKSRLGRGLNNVFGSAAYAKEELCAEFCATFLCAEFGLTSSTHHVAYLQNWIKRLEDDPSILWKAAGQAKKAMDYVKAGVEKAMEKAPKAA